MSEPLFDEQNAGYVQLLYEEYLRNPSSVPPAWQEFFSLGPVVLSQAGLLVEAPRGRPPPPQAPAAPSTSPPPPAGPTETERLAPGVAPPEPPATPGQLRLVARAAALVHAFREHGHQLARLDPLGSEPPGHPELDPAFFGTTMEELQEVPAEIIEPRWGEESLARVLERLREAYCGSLGYEFEHLEDPAKVRWLWEQVEAGTHTQPLSSDEKKTLLRRLSEVEGLEHFLHRAYLGQKRFSIEGTDMLVPMLDEAVSHAARAGAREVVIGMAHRGRLNVLAHVLGVSYREILEGFEGKPMLETALSVPRQGTGDVKYHFGAEGMREAGGGREVRIVLAPNPSHLEFVDPVVEGQARARQFEGPERDRAQDFDAVLPVLIHGDAAFAAEGVVAETLNLARLEGYRTGGTLHIIVNNQVGFTTDPRDGRSTRYSSDLAKGYDIPVIHVNADDPEACLAAVRLAMAYRTRFHDDFVIDLVGYRRHGHNEGDEPAYTQPLLYRRIDAHPTVRELWAKALLAEELVTEEEVHAITDEVLARLRAGQDAVKEEADRETDLGDVEEGALRTVVDTRVPTERLLQLNDAAFAVPPGFKVHPKLARQLERRRHDFGAESSLDWAHAETLAFASLLEEDVPVRLTGQDSERGTFSQRHLALHDIETGERHVPLEHIGKVRFEVHNSPLTETAVLGFEYGFDGALPRGLVLWEAQFGDFVNVAQVIVDQFIAAGEAKWGRASGLVLLLPHGHEGQGPEHTSARLERFLQLAAGGNLRVTYPTTPAQYFHLLRRQALSPQRRPLVVLTPKSLLRHPRATSPLSELAGGSFAPVLPEPPEGDAALESVRRLVLCTGKVYYDLLSHPDRPERKSVGIVRVEELHPFPAAELEALVSTYPNLEEVVWVQEEPMNMGALFYVGPRLRAVVPRSIPLRPISRPPRASPAEGKSKDHAKEQRRIIEEALAIG